MLRSFYDVVTIIYLSTIFIWFHQSKTAQCQDYFNSNVMDDNAYINREFFYDSPEELFIRLDNVFNGVTHLRSSLPSQYISDSGWLNSNEYFVRFNSIIRNLLYGKLLVGSLNKLNQISAVSLSFYDMYDNIIQDYNGQPLIYTSITQDLGQFLEFSQEGFDYSYARFLFRLLSNINFDPNAIFFHFAHPLITTSTSISTSTSTSISTSTTTSTSTSTWPDFSSATINGPSEVFTNFTEEIFNVSMPCPSNLFCMWMLDNISVAIDSNTSVALTFTPRQIGNRTLSFVAFVNGNYKHLVSHSVSVKPAFETVGALFLKIQLPEGLWNTTAGGNGSLSRPGEGPGTYKHDRPPIDGMDYNILTRYKSYGSCGNNSNTSECGINTGLHWIFGSCASLIVGLQFSTGERDQNRDPLTITIEGSNQNSSNLLLGSSWTMIYNGSTGLENVINRTNYGTVVWMLDNVLWFTSYRLLVTSKRGPSDSVDYADVHFFGYWY